MITALAAIVLGIQAPIELYPTDDVWVYPHAGDPQTDEYLRVWGTDGISVAGDPASAESFGYSFLRFDGSKLPKGVTVTNATLVLIHTPDPAWTADDAKKAPLEARVLSENFSEKGWEYGFAKKVFPKSGQDNRFGTFAPAKIESGKPIKFEIDLSKGPAKLDRFLKSGDPFLIALTSTLDPSAVGNRATYKFFSKDYEKAEYRPKLIIQTK